MTSIVSKECEAGLNITDAFVLKTHEKATQHYDDLFVYMKSVSTNTNLGTTTKHLSARNGPMYTIHTAPGRTKA